MKFPTDLTNWRKRDDGLWVGKMPYGKNGGWQRYLYYERICNTCGGKMLASKSAADRNVNCGQYCSCHCVPKQSGNAHASWKGGRVLNDGYVWIKNRRHPRSNKNGYVYEHILVAEKKINRSIAKGEVVHHVNFNPSDNRPENLIVLNMGKHLNLHRRANKLKGGEIR